MDSGTSDGGADQELARIGNFMTGGNENQTSTQPGPTARTQQIDMPMYPFGSPAATNLLLTDPEAQVPANGLLYTPDMDGNFDITPISAMSVDGKSIVRMKPPSGDSQKGWGDSILDALNELGTYMVGIGDAVSGGLTNDIRDLCGTNDVVDKESAAYGAGVITGIGISIPLASMAARPRGPA